MPGVSGKSNRIINILAIAFFGAGFLIGFQNCGKVNISGSVANTSQTSAGSPVKCSDATPGACSYQWGPGQWGACNTTCGNGTQSQTQKCVRSDGTPADPSQCPNPPAPQTQSCSDYSACTYGWIPGGWGACSTTCGTGTQSRNQNCQRSDGSPSDPSKCPPQSPQTQSCSDYSSCTYSWVPGTWGPCSTTCGTGTQNRNRTCTRSDGTPEDPSKCPITNPESQSCSDYSGCAALACTSAFSPSTVSVPDITSKASSTLVINAPTGTSGSYSCVTDPVVAGVPTIFGTYQGSSASIVLNFAYPVTCTVTTNRPDGSQNTCNAHLDVTCSANVAQTLYNATVVQKTGTQQKIADDCADGSMSAQVDLTFSSTTVNRFQKWQINCATRFCVAETGDPNAMGYIPMANVTFNSANTALDPSASSTANCQYNATQQIQQSTNVCQVQVNQAPALQTYNFSYAIDGSAIANNPCGSNVSAVMSSIISDPVGPNGSITCGTKYCKDLGLGYQAGALTDFNYSVFAIRCTRATGIYP